MERTPDKRVKSPRLIQTELCFMNALLNQNPQSATIKECLDGGSFKKRHVKPAPFLTYLAVLPFEDPCTPARQILEISFYRGIGCQTAAVWITAPGYPARQGSAEGKASQNVNSEVMVEALANAGILLKIPVLERDVRAEREAVAAAAEALGYPNAVIVAYCPRSV